MRKLFIRVVVGVVLLSSSLPRAVYTVSQDGSGGYTSVQAAIDNATAGDEIVILDFATYNEQVTIDSSKNRLVLRSENPKLQQKPVIKFKDTINVGPRTYEESLNPATITFDQNGAARVLRAHGVTIAGIIFDGGGYAPYGYSAIWNRQSSLFSGNAALTLYVCGDIVLRNCEFRNAYFGLYIKDRNEGGIYANANPADLQPWNIVPLSGFGKTGSHLVERNRVHGNAWGVFMESAWDLGSTFRYNLFYENRVSSDLAEIVEPLEGSDNQWGGAMTFKDVLLTPMAIYNNTFYKNGMNLCADWQAGGGSLVFNNIFAEPDTVPVLGVYAQGIDPALPNRIYNSLYASQVTKLKTRSQSYTDGMTDPQTNEYIEGEATYTGYGYVAVMGGFPALNPTVQTIDIPIPLSTDTIFRQARVDWAIAQGALISQTTADEPFPATANNRWFEIPFKSIDPEESDFLSPDWNDSLSYALVADQGWEGGGMRDADGTRADIGAVPLGGVPETVALVKAKDPVFIEGTDAKLSFTVTPLEGTFSNPKIKYLKWVRNITYQADIWGAQTIAPIPESDIVDVSIPATPLGVGSNVLTVTIPSMSADYGFFDIVVEGTDGNGNTVTTNAAFLPYRKIDYVFEVVIMDADGTTELSEVHAGEHVQLWITPLRLDGKSFDATVERVSVSLSSNFSLFTPAGELFAITMGVSGTTKHDCMFTKVPPGGFDGVSVSGVFTNPGDTTNSFAIRGSSKDIKILPGPAEMISFFDPPSQGVAVVDRGVGRLVTVVAFDKYENRVNTPAEIGVVSQEPDVGSIGPSSVTTDTTGMALFAAMVTNGELYDTFPVIATLLSNSATDNAKLVVGKPKDRLWILFSDTAAYDETVTIHTCAGERVPVTIIVSKDGTTTEPVDGTGIILSTSGGLAAYGSSDPDDTVKITNATLTGGTFRFWIKSTIKNVTNGSVSVSSTDGSVQRGDRDGINFKSCNAGVVNAAYFSENGFGQVDRVVLYFEKELSGSEIPDSLLLRWPSTQGEVRHVKKDQCVLDTSDSSHLIVTLPEPFAQEVTRFAGSNLELGTYYWWNKDTPDDPTQVVGFQINDSVGPLITSAMLVERLGEGADTLYLEFSETVIADVVMGQSLELIRNGLGVPLVVSNVIPQSANKIIAVIDDMGAESPAAGDSIRITAAGPVIDGSRNHAHPENRPVTLLLRKVPADISGAAYYDTNADGTVDRIRVAFNKEVNPLQMSVMLLWDMDSASRALTASEISVADGDTSRVLYFQVPESVFDSAVFKGRTSGNMAVKVSFTAFTENNVRYATVVDKAAPVLATVLYSVSKDSKGESVGDTVKFSFSEEVEVDASGDEPLLFENSNGAYMLKLAWYSYSSNAYSYLVTKNSGADGNVVFPQVNDSSWINASAGVITDLSGNVQNNPENRRVAVRLALPDFEPEILVGPNPFNPADGTQCHIVVRPKTGLAVIEAISVTAEIYDKVGNRVASLSSGASPTKVDLLWNGTNYNGRLVGSGSYLMIVKCSFTIQGEIRYAEPQQVTVGVQR